MLKLTIGFVIGCFVTYNFIMPYPAREQLLAEANRITLQLLQKIQEELKSNVEDHGSN
tara:strand:+ start:2664 stop:2837 length:174 start_codon:yes stop_codon:yes gene_type:complete